MDDTALTSLEILSEAVEMAFAPGRLDLRALRTVIDVALANGSAEAAQEAYALYAALDKPERDAIEAHALTLATVRRRANRDTR